MLKGTLICEKKNDYCVHINMFKLVIILLCNKNKIIKYDLMSM